MAPFSSPQSSLRLPSWAWVLLWTALGAILRFWNLGDKTPWADEWSTLLFSAGRGYGGIPLDTPFGLDTLLQPLQTPLPWQPEAVLERLRAESNHPPLFFLLTHLWLQLWLHVWSQGAPLLSLTATRALSALLGTLTIPLGFGVAYSLGQDHPHRSTLAHLTAAFMAVSPFGVYLAQEARHYTLSLLWILLLLGFLGQAVRSVQTGTPLPLWQVLLWVGLNGLALGTHFFYGVALVGAGVVMGGLWVWEAIGGDWGRSGQEAGRFGLGRLGRRHWRRLYAVGLGTGAGGVLWLTAWQSQGEAGLTQWLVRSAWDDGENWGDRLLWLLEPVGRLLAWMVTMVMGAPLEGEVATGALVAAIGLLLLGLGTLVYLLRVSAQLNHFAPIGADRQGYHPQSVSLPKPDGSGPPAIAVAPPYRPFPSTATVLMTLALANTLVFLLLVYGRGLDLTLAPRYQFVSLPVIVLLLAWGLAPAWVRLQSGRKWPRWGIALILGLGLWGSWSVVHNQLYQKPDQADVVIDRLRTVWHEDLSPEQQQAPLTLVFLHHTTGETGKLLSLGWELQQVRQILPEDSSSLGDPQLLLAHWQTDREEGTQVLHRFLQTAPRPLALWVVNFSAARQDVEPFGCAHSTDRHPHALGYWSRLYHCPASPLDSPAP